jgi:hypothetical protein
MTDLLKTIDGVRAWVSEITKHLQGRAGDATVLQIRL